ncbi:hypothetical protein REPUB_Repub03eG0063700 [Reevesia pubescens]
MEEVDHLERSAKKIKASLEGANGETVHVHAACSSKDTLFCGKKDSATVVKMGNIDKVTLDFKDDWVEDDKIADVPVDDTIPFVNIDTDSFKNVVFRCDVDQIDIGLGYYVVKFDLLSDLMKDFTAGP